LVRPGLPAIVRIPSRLVIVLTPGIRVIARMPKNRSAPPATGNSLKVPANQLHPRRVPAISSRVPAPETSSVPLEISSRAVAEISNRAVGETSSHAPVAASARASAVTVRAATLAVLLVVRASFPNALAASALPRVAAAQVRAVLEGRLVLAVPRDLPVGAQMRSNISGS
jgi:hypothetical protein